MGINIKVELTARFLLLSVSHLRRFTLSICAVSIITEIEIPIQKKVIGDGINYSSDEESRAFAAIMWIKMCSPSLRHTLDWAGMAERQSR